MARAIERGDIYLVEFQTPDKRRPALVLSRSSVIRYMNTVIVAPITSTIRGLPSEVRLGLAHGLKNDSVASLDHIATVPKDRLVVWVGRADSDIMQKICQALQIAVGCEGLENQPIAWP